MRTLHDFLKKHNDCPGCYDFAKDITLEQFLNSCDKGEWILWLFKNMNPDSLRELTLAKAYCANTVRHLMKDERSTKAIDIAIKFGNNEVGKKELNEAVAMAADAANDASRARKIALSSNNIEAYETASYAAFATHAANLAIDDSYAAAFGTPYATANAAACAARVPVGFALRAADNIIKTTIDADAREIYDAYTADANTRASDEIAAAARKQNQKLTADICRKYLPLEIWNQEVL